MAQILQGTAFITGAASGIGQHAALAFAKHGITRLALADINPSTLKATNEALRAKYPNVEILELALDVRDTKAVEKAVAETVARFGRLDVALNNAGIGGSGKATHEVDEDDWNNVLDIDLHGVWRCQRAQIKVMLEQEDLGPRIGRGRIINVASMYGILAPSAAIPATAYAAAKHGVVGLTQADANSYGPRGIRINAICPGYVKTPLLQSAMSQDYDAPLAVDVRRTPLQRMCEMEEIADCIAFLASEMSSFMQGASLIADGGFTVQ